MSGLGRALLRSMATAGPMLLSTLVFGIPIAGQVDSTMAQEGIYDRPFIASASNTSIGGYVEGNTNYFVEDGVSEGFSMELRRFNIFMYSSISQRVRFISELEFEHGTEEIALETALIDLHVSPALVVREIGRASCRERV